MDLVTVEFIEQGTNTPFAVLEVPIEQLPDVFEIQTNLEIGPQQWNIVAATPNRKEEFERTGKLQITLNKIDMLDPTDILFSLPTLNDSIFEIEADFSKNLFLIHEDDWRQVEFISKNYKHKINQEIKSILEIYKKHKRGIGYNQVHLRKLVEQPLRIEKINLEEIKRCFKIVKQYDGFGITKGGGKASGSFAFEVADEVVFYGQATNENCVNFLCVAGSEKSEQSVERIIKVYDLVYVDWCQAEVFEKSAESD